MKKFLLMFVVTVFIFTGCKDQNAVEPAEVSGSTLEKSYQLSGAVKAELQYLKSVTAKYHDIKKAEADGYEEGPTIPNMGVHFINMGLIADGVFDLDNPEILVYQLHDNGRYELVAIEFAAPLSLPNPPEGFTGSDDEWGAVNPPGIWALHAWIWKYNPDGVFNATNSQVP